MNFRVGKRETTKYGTFFLLHTQYVVIPTTCEGFDFFAKKRLLKLEKPIILLLI